jgi:hypothetical protein
MRFIDNILVIIALAFICVILGVEDVLSGEQIVVLLTAGIALSKANDTKGNDE